MDQKANLSLYIDTGNVRTKMYQSVKIIWQNSCHHFMLLKRFIWWIMVLVAGSRGFLEFQSLKWFTSATYILTWVSCWLSNCCPKYPPITCINSSCEVSNDHMFKWSQGTVYIHLSVPELTQLMCMVVYKLCVQKFIWLEIFNTRGNIYVIE